MSIERFEFGDRVRHAKRPEWGIGSVMKVQEVPGSPAQRLTVRFAGAGVKTLNTDHAELQRVVDEPASAPDADDGTSSVAHWDRVGQSEWLAPVAQKKIEEAMVSLPADARDAFATLADRLRFTLGLYRSNRGDRGLSRHRRPRFSQRLGPHCVRR